MKKHTLFQRLLLPTIIVLVLLPPLSCFIFYQAANHYAYTQAVHDLETLQQQILPLMNSCFTTMPDSTGSKTNTHSTVSDNRRSGSNKTNYNNDYHKPSDTDTPVTAQQVQNFLSQAGPLAARMKGDAQLLILGTQQQVIYPRDERQQATVAPLAAEFILEIPNPTSTVENNNTVKFKASDGQHYLVNIYRVPTQSTQIRHLITYCPTSQIGDWVGNASILVLAISSLFVCLTLLFFS